MDSPLQCRALLFKTEQVLYFVDANHISWFRALDIATILRFEQPDKVVRDDTPEKYKKCVNNIVFVSEYGLFAMIMKSKFPVSAERFGVWMFEDVLPSVRNEERERMRKEMQGFEDDVEKKFKNEMARFKAEIARVNARVGALETWNRRLRLENQDLNRQCESQLEKIDVIKEQRVVPTEDPHRQHYLLIFRKNEDVSFPYFAMRVQERYIQQRITEEIQKYPRMQRIFITGSPNSVNLFNRVKAKRLFGFRNDSRDCYNSFNISASEEELITYIQSVHDERLE